MNEKHKLRIGQVPLDALIKEEGVEELLHSDNMGPYLRLAQRHVEGGDLQPILKEISQIPLQNRYVWRVVSALKWALRDLDEFSVVADMRTLSPDDIAKVLELVRLRPLQFCIFLTALVGEESMDCMMTDAVAVAFDRARLK